MSEVGLATPMAFATGLKIARPAMKVITIMGDGDALAIGGNHLIHAARRNIGITAIVVDNAIYGMTGGQYSPTTPIHGRASTAPYGNIEPPMPICELAIAAGATYVARFSVTQPVALINSIKKAILHGGFSFIDALSPCPTLFGRRNRLDRPDEMIQDLIERCLLEEEAVGLTEEERAEKIITGEFLS